MPSKIAFNADDSDVTQADLESAVNEWTSSPHCANSLPDTNVWDSAQDPLSGDTETWVAKTGTYQHFIDNAPDTSIRDKLSQHMTDGSCAGVILGTNTVYLFDDAAGPCPSRVSMLTHEFGHLLRLEEAGNAKNPDNTFICSGSIMFNMEPRSITTEACMDAKRELDKVVDCMDSANDDHPDCQEACSDDEEEAGSSAIFDVDENGMLVFVGSQTTTCPPPPGGHECPVDDPNCDDDRPDRDDDSCEGNPGPNCPVDCDANPFHTDCAVPCWVNPDQPECGRECDVDPAENDGICKCEDYGMTVADGKCVSPEFSVVPGGPQCPRPTGPQGASGTPCTTIGSLLPFSLTAQAASSRKTYYFRTTGPGLFKVSLSGMTGDFDCHVYPAHSKRPQSCTLNSGTTGDWWAGNLGAGTHTIRVWPFGTGSGNYTAKAESITSLPAPMGYTTDLLPFSLTNTVTSNNPGDLHHDFKLTASADVTVSLTGMTANFDCTVGTNNCSNNAGNADDTWSGTLAAGSHRIAVSISALETSGGTYTLSAAADPPTPTDPDGNDDEDDDEDDDDDADDDPDPPGAPTLSGSVTVTKHILTWTAPTSSSDITGYRLESRASATTNWGSPTGGSATASSLSATTLTWNIVTSASAVRFYRVVASNEDGEGPWSNEIKLESDGPPAQVSITGSVSNRTQTVSWTAPQSDSAITKYQLQTRSSASASWRWPGAGSPTASNMPATTRSWSVTTPAGLTRHYRVRAVSALGDGAWSSHVELTSASPPPLSAPGIPNFDNLPSAGTVNTTFAVATGGTPPYSYSLSGLPPGITFNAATRVASGTLPIVSRRTTYNLTYTVTDSASATDSESFTATVVPPAKPGAPTLNGSVTRQTQSLSWTVPTSPVSITGYQLQVRNSSTSGWRCTSAGSGASCSLSGSTTSWSVTTPAGMTRHYRVRASNAGGSGAWSNEVVVTSGG